jgi:hypothetical protein
MIVCVRTDARSPSKRCVAAFTHGALPGSRRMAHAKQTVPTGLSGVPPSGPAMPVTATATCAALCDSAPIAIARATGSLTAPKSRR